MPTPAPAQPEPPAPPKAIKDIVSSQLAALEITSAVVVDDAFSPSIDVNKWAPFVEVLRKDAELLARVEELVSKEKGDIEEPPSDRLLLTIRRLVAAQDNAAYQPFLSEPQADPALTALTTALGALGLSVQTYWRVDEAPKDAHLYFVDYRLQPEADDTHGHDASRLITEALKNTGPLGKAPGAVLMSRSEGDPSEPNTAAQEDVVRHAGGFVRCNFRYIDKAQLLEPARLHFILSDLLSSLPVGREYFQQVKALKDAARSTVDIVAGEICSLIPADFRIFANRVSGHPQGTERIAAHLLSVFARLLSAELRNSAEIDTTVRAFRKLLDQPGMLAPDGMQSHSLHRIHSKLIYDRSKSATEGPLEFGDIFSVPSRPGTYMLLLTPECDLEPRAMAGEHACPKVDRVLLISGKPVTAPDTEDETATYTPLFIDRQHEPASWIRWDLRSPRYMPWQRLLSEKGHFKRWGRLRNAEAEAIQLYLARDLLAVGTEDVSGHVQIRPCTLWEVKTKNDPPVKLADLQLSEVASVDHEGEALTLWALAPGCETDLCSPTRTVMPADLLLALRQYMPKADFKLKLKGRVGVHEAETTIHLGWYTNAQFRPQSWPGPPAPPAPTPTAEAGVGETNDAAKAGAAPSGGAAKV